MTVLTQKEINEQFKPSKDEIDKYFKNHPKLKRTKANTQKIRDRIKASKIVRSPGKEVSFTQSAAEWQMIYGTQKCGGVITFVSTNGTNHQVLHMVVTIAAHQINSVLKLYLDDEEVIFGASPDPRWSTGIRRTDGTVAAADHKVFMSVTSGTVGQSANADLVGQLPSLWTANHKQDGCAHVYLIFVWDATLFPNGVPQITFLVEGKPVKLPNGTTSFTNNAAAVIRDYMTNTRFGMGIPEAKIDATQYSTAYDKCNEDVGTISGTEKRYTIDGVLKSSESPSEVLDTMAASMGGTVAYINGLWKIFPAMWIAPTLELTEDDILGDIRVQAKLSRADSFNGVRGTFISPTNNYEETDFPAVKNDFYMTLDNNERVWEDIQLPFTNSPARCQRLSKIELERNRQAITVQMLASLKAYKLQPLDTVNLTISRMGWNAKTFEVQQMTLVLDGGNGGDAPHIAVELLLRETAEGVFDWANGQETPYDLAANSNLPNPLSVPTLQDVALASGTAQLFIRADGTVFSRIKVSWDQPDDFFVTSGGVIQVQFKRTADASWQALTDIPGDIQIAYILDVEDTIEYDVRVRAKNALGVPGPWTTVERHRVIGKTEPPSNVQGFGGSIESFGIRFYWQKVPDLDVNLYEIRIGVLGSAWETAQLLTTVGGNTYSANIRLADEYQFFIKAVDTSGNYSLEAAPLIARIIGPEAPVNLNINLVGDKFLLTWEKPTSPLFAVDQYEIFYTNPGQTFADRTTVSTVRGLTFSDTVRWGGNRFFWVRAVDVAGNAGTPAQVSLNIEIPGTVQNFTTQILDQNVLLRWQEPSRHSVPIARYYVYKGELLEAADLVGEMAGTFAPLFELLGGTYTYWVRAVDTAGNLGDAAKTTAIVQPPSDFVLIENGDPQDQSKPYIDPGTGQGSRFVDDGDRLIMPINEIETWNQHFESNGFNTTQDAVNAGHTYLIQPVPLAAYWTRVLDYGRVVEAALVTLEFSRDNYDGIPTLLTTISYSEDGEVWTTAQGQQAYAQNFRYLRITFQVGAFGEQSGEAMGNIGLTYP